MNLNELYLSEYKHEAKQTRKLLEAVPFDQLGFKPHEKSMSLERLTTHVAEIAAWWHDCLVKDEVNFQTGGFTTIKAQSKEQFLAEYDVFVAKSLEIIANAKNEDFEKEWTMKNGDQVYFTMTKGRSLRTWALNHWYHHRGQLTVYLRLLNIPVPGIYGPSADGI